MFNQLSDILKGAFITRTSGYLDVSAKQTIFAEISEILGGTFTKSHNPGNILATLHLTIPYKKWEIMLTESDTRPLKIKISLDPLTNYDLVACMEDSIDKLMKKLGKTEIEVGNKAFDDEYLIHSNDASLTWQLLDESIRTKILDHSLYSFSLMKDPKANSTEWMSVVSRTVEGKHTYIELVDLHKELIDKLVELGVIA